MDSLYMSLLLALSAISSSYEYADSDSTVRSKYIPW